MPVSGLLGRVVEEGMKKDDSNYFFLFPSDMLKNTVFMNSHALKMKTIVFNV